MGLWDRLRGSRGSPSARPYDEPSPEPYDSLVDLLVEEVLDSVIFVADYLQLDFNGARLSCFVWPLVELQGVACRHPEPGYRDALCALIGRRVSSVTDAPVSGLQVRFDDDGLVVKPDSSELRGPEIAMLQLNDTDRRWEVWRPGEGSFAEGY